MTTCSKCNFCLQVYRCFVLRYDGFKEHYYCEKCNKMTDRDGYCESWQPKVIGFDFSEQRFEEVEEDVKFISEYLKNQIND